jgi:Tfp pilus assembly protein PilO
VQLLNHLSKNTADIQMVIKSIEQSDISDGLKKKIIARADRDTKTMSDEKQVSLLKLGKYNESGWNHLRVAI